MRKMRHSRSDLIKARRKEHEGGRRVQQSVSEHRAADTWKGQA